MRICSACVARFDHHSPWLNNCVGAHNQVAYTAHLALWCLSSFLVASFALTGILSAARGVDTVSGARAVAEHTSPTLGVGGSDSASGSGEMGDAGASAWGLLHMIVLVSSGLSFVYSGVKLRGHINGVSDNVTAFEDSNMRRLTYFRGGRGFQNPFDLGTRGNWMEYLHLSGFPGTRDWRVPQGYTVMDLKGHPLRSSVLAQARAFRTAVEAGQTLQPEQQKLLDACLPMLRPSGDSSSSDEGGESESKHVVHNDSAV